MNKKVKWVGILSTAERNRIGLIRVRQNNVNSEVLGFEIIDGNGEPYDLKNRKVLFCTYFDKFAPVEQYAEVIENGKIIYTMNEHDMQKPVRINFAYFKIMDDKDNLVDTTQNFSYDIMPSVESKCMNSEPYIIRLEEVLDAFNSVRDEAMKEIQQIIVDFNEQVIQQQQDFEFWFESIRDIIESIDPGGILLNEIVDFRYSKMLDKHFQRIKDRGDFWDDELEERAINLRWHGATGENTILDTSAVLNALKRSKELGVPIFVPNQIFKIETDEILDPSLFFGFGKIINNDIDLKIPSTINRIFGKKFKNNDSVSRNTYGTYNTATAFSLIANGETEAEVIGINPDNLKLLARYKDRDSVAMYSKNQTSLNFYDFENVKYEKGSVYIEDLDSSYEIIPGMLIDTFHEPKYSAMIKSVDFENKKINVFGWVKTNTSELDVIPENTAGLRINPTTSIWTHNMILELKENHPKSTGTMIEMDVINNQDHQNVKGIDLISMGKKKSGSALVVRSTNKNNEWENALVIYNQKNAIKVEGTTNIIDGIDVQGDIIRVSKAKRGVVVDGIAHKNAFLESIVGDDLYRVTADGTLNMLRLKQVVNNSNATLDLTNSVHLLNGSNTNMPDPENHAEKLIFLVNAINSDVTVKGVFRTGGNKVDSLIIKSNKAVLVVSNGASWRHVEF